MLLSMSPSPPPHLTMIWPRDRHPPTLVLPAAYALRPAQPGDDDAVCALMALAGWPGWTPQRLQPWRQRSPADSWLLVAQRATGTIVATAMGLDDPTPWHPQGGEVGWVASHPAHRGQGLGASVAVAVIRRLRALGYEQMHLFTEDYRLPALTTYLRIGLVPYLESPQLLDRWRRVCQALGWPWTPERWPDANTRF